MIGVRFNPEKYDYGPVRINWHFTDLNEDHVLGIQRSTIYHDPLRKDDDANAAIITTRKTIARILGAQETLEEALASEDLVIEGDERLVKSFIESQESFVTAPLIEPKGQWG